MHNRTVAEITEFFAKTFNVGKTEISVNIGPKRCLVKIDTKNIYSFGVSYDMLLKLSEFFGTKSIDLNDFSKTRGCESCDYGAVFSMRFNIKEDSSV